MITKDMIRLQVVLPILASSFLGMSPLSQAADPAPAETSAPAESPGLTPEPFLDVVPEAPAATTGAAPTPAPEEDIVVAVPKDSSAPQIKENASNRYVVKKGDTLWGIAAHFLKDPWRWPEVWKVNPKIRNPHLIYPGDVVALHYVDGKPVLILEGQDIPQTTSTGRPVVKLSPKARTEALRKAVSSLPKEAIRPFLVGPYLLGRDDLDNAPYVVSSQGGHLASGTGGKIYARGLDDTGKTAFVAVRQGETYRDPDNGKFLGIEAINLADVTLQKKDTLSTLLINKSRQEVHVGDYLVPAEKQDIDLNFFPRPPSTPVTGKIMSVYQGVSKIGQYSVVVINRGEENGLEPGHILEVYQAGEVVRDPNTRRRVRLPEERAGLLMVFRPYRKISYALVMQAEREMSVKDIVKSP